MVSDVMDGFKPPVTLGDQTTVTGLAAELTLVMVNDLLVPKHLLRTESC